MFKTHIRLQYEGLLLMPIKTIRIQGNRATTMYEQVWELKTHGIISFQRAYNVAGEHKEW